MKRARQRELFTHVPEPRYLTHIILERDSAPSFERYPFNLPAIRSLDRLELHPRVNFFIGENGSGKSTLLEAIAVKWGFNAEGGTKNFDFSTRTSHSDLCEYLRLSRSANRPMDGFFFRAESFFNAATYIENTGVGDSYGGRSLHEMSHGEAFLTLMTTRVHGQGLYILDEPEAALSPQRQLAIITRMHDLVMDCSQFLIATHSPILMAYPDAWIFECSGDGLRRIEYEETEHFQVTRDFLMNPARMIKLLTE